MLGERGLWYKMSWFEPSARVPLVIHAPFLFGPRRVSQVVSLVDLLPTLMEVGDAPLDPELPLDGRSLLPHLTGSGGHDEAIGTYLGEGAIAPLLMIRRGPWKLVTSQPDPDQLHDLEDDPLERTDLAQLSEHRDRVQSLKAALADRIDSDALHLQVLASQRRRRLVDAAMRRGSWTAWDHQPRTDASVSYVRSQLVLDDLDAARRWPRV
jgi:choline-sulfatase